MLNKQAALVSLLGKSAKIQTDVTKGCCVNQDLNEIYRQSVQICTLFAACCQTCANFGLADIAIQSSYPVVCRFLLEDTPHASDRAHALSELIRNLNGFETIKNDWYEHHDQHLRELVAEFSSRTEAKMNDKHIKKMAQLWEFGKNIPCNSNTMPAFATEIGLNQDEFVSLNKFLVASEVVPYYNNFFEFTMEVWCERARMLHTQTAKLFEKINHESSLHVTKVKP